MTISVLTVWHGITWSQISTMPNFERRLQPIGTRVICPFTFMGVGIILIALFHHKLYSKGFRPNVEFSILRPFGPFGEVVRTGRPSKKFLDSIRVV